jgi:hypothetical protein
VANFLSGNPPFHAVGTYEKRFAPHRSRASVKNTMKVAGSGRRQFLHPSRQRDGGAAGNSSKKNGHQLSTTSSPRGQNFFAANRNSATTWSREIAREGLPDFDCNLNVVPAPKREAA